jgi:hypothetical protein
MRAKKSKSEPTTEPTPAWRVWADDAPLIGVKEVLLDDGGIKDDTKDVGKAEWRQLYAWV